MSETMNAREATSTFGTVLVTGASGGIGLAIAKRLAPDCDRLVLVARESPRLAAAAESLGALARVDAIPADLARPGAAEALLAALAERGLAIDTLVNNAGVAMHGSFAALPADEQRDMLELNVVALAALTRGLLPGMLARRRGRVLNVASTAAYQAGPWMTAYYASKAFVLSFSEGLRHELRGTGVIVTALCPGPTATGFQSRARMEGARLLGMGLTLGADAVARRAVAGLRRGSATVIPGLLNRLGIWSVKFSPRFLVIPVLGWLNAKRA